jgi:hypothetical protein
MSLPLVSSTVHDGERAEPQDCFVVYVRNGSAHAARPEAMERPVAACPSYEEAARIRDRYRQEGRTCIIRFVGQTGGGD